jgi:hypothetical protein
MKDNKGFTLKTATKVNDFYIYINSYFYSYSKENYLYVRYDNIEIYDKDGEFVSDVTGMVN